MPLKCFLSMMLCVCPFFLLPPVQAQETQVQYLSGHDKDDAVPWDFHCNGGRRGGPWTTIPVPSNWELQVSAASPTATPTSGTWAKRPSGRGAVQARVLRPRRLGGQADVSGV